MRDMLRKVLEDTFMHNGFDRTARSPPARVLPLSGADSVADNLSSVANITVTTSSARTNPPALDSVSLPSPSLGLTSNLALTILRSVSSGSREGRATLAFEESLVAFDLASAEFVSAAMSAVMSASATSSRTSSSSHSGASSSFTEILKNDCAAF